MGEDIEGEDIEVGRGLRKFLDTQKGSSEKTGWGVKICILQNQQVGGGAPKKLNH